MLQLERPLVLFDLEATGTDPDTARIIQIAMRKRRPDSDEIMSFSTLVNPQQEVPERITRLTGIDPDEVADAPTFGDVADRVREYIEDADLAGYSITGYDVPLLQAEWNRHVDPYAELPGPDDRTLVDGYAIERQLRPRDLASVYRRYAGEDPPVSHDASADVDTTMYVLQRQISEVHDRQGSTPTPADVADFARGDYLDDQGKLKRRDSGAVEVCFGKYSGQTITEIHEQDPGYLRWMASEIDGLRTHIDAALSTNDTE